MNELFKTYKNVFDEKTIRAIWYLITHNQFEGLESPLKTGKESNVFTALTKSGERVAVKIFRINSSSFFKMSKYLEMDPRFRHVHSTRGIVLTWAKREFINLTKAYEAGVKVPRPIALRENVIVMGFIGNQPPKYPIPDPMLKDNCNDPETIYKNALASIKKLYGAKLIHGDLNEFNMLNSDDDPTLIDLSHSTPISAPAAPEILERDVDNLCRFFKKKGLRLVKEDVIREIKKGHVIPIIDEKQKV